MRVKVTACKCERCGHVWVPRTPNPLRCGKCKTPYWDRPRQQKKKKKR